MATMKRNLKYDFLLVSMQACASLMIGCINADKQVIVVGAGVSGVAAARRLRDSGSEYKITILEARSRPGGRIWTKTNGLPTGSAAEFDVGASWIHGYNTRDHPIGKLVRKYGLNIVETDWDTLKVFDRSGNEVSATAIGSAYDSLLYIIENYLNMRAKNETDAQLEQLSAEQLMRRSSLYNRTLDSSLGRLFTSIEVDFDRAASIDQLSARWLDGDAEFDGEEMLIKEGYGALIERMIHSHGDASQLSLRYGARVIWIGKNDMNNARPYIVKTANGDRFDCDNIIFTVPLGVMKESSITFEPPLPRRQLDAIRNVGFGTVNKLAIEFDKVFWPDSSTQFYAVAPDTSLGRENDGFATTFLNTAPLSGRPTLMTFIVGKDAVASESLTDNALAERALTNLRAIFGSSAVANSKVQRIERSRWYNDEESRGSYSFIAKGSTPCDFAWLARPHCEAGVYFAGEHTIYSYHGSVHGAYLSGVRAANEVIKRRCTRENNAPEVNCNGEITTTGYSTATRLHETSFRFLALYIVFLTYFSAVRMH